MNKQYWCCTHAWENQTQTAEEDSNLRDFLNKHQVNLITGKLGIVSQASDGFLEHQAKRALLFFDYKYNRFTNLSNKIDHRFCLYGVRGIHALSRETKYANFYFSDEKDLLGVDFFRYIFGSVYLTEEEAKAVSVKETMEKKQMEIDNSQFVYPQILEKDRNLVCRIVERLWTTKLENSGTRLIICMEGINIQERSVELLKQIYLLLPQRLRLDMGFATCSTFNDIKTLTEKCDLPISVFTMATDDIEKARQIVDETEFRYPIILFDAESPENEPCDIKKLELLTSLSRKISPSTDAKIGYAEKIVLKEKRGMVSFKNMESTLEKINGEPFCWWERKDLEKIEEVYNLYEDQKEMMEVEILRRESLNTFYTKLLPWKDYAKQIAQVVEDDNYPNRQEILKFFSEELKFAKVIEAMEEMRESLEKKSIEHEQKAVAGVEASWKADVAQQQKQHQAALAEKDRECTRLRDEKDQNTQEYEQRLKKQEERFSAECTTKNKEFEAALKNEADRHQKEITAEKEAHKAELSAAKIQSNQEIKKLNSIIDKLRNTDANQNLRMLQNQLDASDKQKEKMHEQAEAAEKKRKLFLITTIAVGGAAVIFLVLTIIFAMKGSGAGKLEQANQKLESEMAVLESEKKDWQSKQKELEDQVSSLQERNASLETEKESLENLQKEKETEKETLTGINSEGKALVIYYTYAKGSTKAVAKEIKKQTGADMVELKTVEEYPSDYDSVVQKLTEDYNNGVASELSETIENMDAYDTIFLGYPVWGGTMPSAISTFLDAYDLTGKTVVPFCTCDNSGAAATGTQLKEAEPGATFCESLEIADTHIADDAQSIEETESPESEITETGTSESESSEEETDTGENSSETAESGNSDAEETTSEFTEKVTNWLTQLGLLQKN